MMFIVLLLFFAKADSVNTFPFFPILINRYKRNIIQNYFDMNHISDKSPHGKILKKVVLDLKQNISVGYNIDKLEQLINLKNGNAAFILGIINEFGLFGNEIDDAKAARYYAIGSKYGNIECKSSLAYYYRYGIGGLESDMQKAKQLTKESMEKCVFSALRMAMIFYEENRIDKAISVILPIASLTINNSTFFDFFYNADHEIKKFDGLSLPTKLSESNGDYLQALSNTGNYNAKLQLVQKALGNRDYDKAVELVTDYYTEIEMAEATLKSKEEIERFDSKYGPYYVIIGMMKKYGININAIKKDNESSLNTEKTSILKNRPKSANKTHSLTSNQLIQKAFRIGDPLAFTEIAYFFLTRGNEKASEIGKSLLMAAVNISYIPAIHLYGVNLLNGRRPFIKDINLAKQCFIQCYKEKKYLPSMLNLALIHQAYENNPEKAFLILNELVEYSFLFSDSQKAYKATLDGNYQLSLQYYKRLADIGSNNASFNVYQLYKRNGNLLNQSVEEKYFNKYKNYYDFDKNYNAEQQKQENIDDIRKKWLVESSPDAYYENGEQLLKEGKDIQKAIECFKRGSKSNGYSAFKAGMLIMKENPEESLSYFNRAQNLKKMLKWAVAFMKTRIFIENIPYLFKNRRIISSILFHRSEIKYVEPFDLFMTTCTYRVLNVLSYVVPFLVMYFLIVIRFKITNSNEHFITKSDQQLE